MPTRWRCPPDRERMGERRFSSRLAARMAASMAGAPGLIPFSAAM